VLHLVYAPEVLSAAPTKPFGGFFGPPPTILVGGIRSSQLFVWLKGFEGIKWMGVLMLLDTVIHGPYLPLYITCLAPPAIVYALLS